ncbi:MAG TPA: hypothetical protein VHL98_04335 [Microvirga sp.]|jgi:hypothetical protein|nr:hypothetical protein [Microvirga sp.]
MRRIRNVLRALAASSTLALSFAAAAQAPDSVYTQHDPGRCPVVREHETGRTHRCTGHRGIPVSYEIDEHSVLVGIGTAGEVASTPFLVRRFAEAGDTVEWRGPRGRGGIEPRAAILRFRVTEGPSIGAKRHDVLVVYRLDPARSCIAAVLDGRSPDANAQARRIADGEARRFRCGRDAPPGFGE